MLRLRNCRQVERLLFVSGKFVEEMTLFPPIEIVGIGGFAIELSGLQIHGTKLHEAFGVRVGEGANQYCIENAEHSRVGADAEGESEDSNSRKGGRFTELAESEVRVGEDGVEPIAEAFLADLFFELFDAAEFDAGAALGFGLLHSSTEVFLCEHFEVGENFFVQLRVHTIRQEEIAQEASDPHKERHGNSTLLPFYKEYIDRHIECQ